MHQENLRGGSYRLSSVALCEGGQVAFIQDTHSIKDIMKSQGIPDFQATPPIPKFIDTEQAIDETPSYDSFEPSPDEF